MTPLLLRFIGGLVFFVVSVSMGWIMHGWKYDSEYKESYIQAVAEVKTQDLARQEMAKAYERKVSAYQKQVDALNGQVKTEVTEHSVYSECVLPDSGVQLINAAIESANKIITSK